MIDEKHVSNVLDVLAFQGLNIDTNQNLAARYTPSSVYQRTPAKTKTRKVWHQKAAITKNSIVYIYSLRVLVTKLLTCIRKLWDSIACFLWYDDNCRVEVKTKHAAYLTTLRSLRPLHAQGGIVSANWRGKQDVFVDKKEREAELHEVLADKGSSRKLFEMLRRIPKGFNVEMKVVIWWPIPSDCLVCGEYTSLACCMAMEHVLLFSFSKWIIDFYEDLSFHVSYILGKVDILCWRSPATRHFF